MSLLLRAKFPEFAQFTAAPPGEMAMFRLTPHVVSVLDDRKGLGHADLVHVGDPARTAHPAEAAM